MPDFTNSRILMALELTYWILSITKHFVIIKENIYFTNKKGLF